MYSFHDEENSYYRQLIAGFNQYARERGLGISVELTILTPETSTKVIENYGTTIDSLLLEKSKKYDIYFYYSAYSEKYGDHFVDFYEYLPEEYIKPFDERILKETCSSKDNRLVGMPIYLYITSLFSNMDLLTKYNKEIPKTWDDLMSTSKLIYDEEKKVNNTIIRYNGLFNDYSGSMTLYEFINSYRESNDSPHPELTSDTTIEALEKIKEMKDEIGEDIFRAPDDDTFESIFGSGKMLFLRYFYTVHSPVYRGSALPGRKEGVSGTVVIPNNFAVNRYIDEDRKLAAMEFIKYAMSKESQKKYIIGNFMFSAITELYDDPDVCSFLECDIVKDSYPFSFMSNDVKLFGDDNYHIKYRSYMLDYLYNDKPVKEVLKKIDDITRVHNFTWDTDESYAGIIILSVFLILFIGIILSLVFLYMKKYEKRFKFLSKEGWIITTVGSLILLCAILTLYGDVTNAKCQLRITLITFGFVLTISPSLLKMIANFPEPNKVSTWVVNNKYRSMVIVMVFTLLLNGLLALFFYDPEDMVSSDGKNYKKCMMNNAFGDVVYYIIQLYDVLIIILSLILIFIEWNLKETCMDVKFIAAALFMSALSLILFNIIDKVQFKNYIIYSILLAINIMIFAVSNHLFIYLIRVLPLFGNDSKYENSRKFLGKISTTGFSDSRKYSLPTSTFNKQSMVNSTYNNNNNSNKTIDNFTPLSTISSSNDSKINGFTKRIMNYHNQRDISDHSQKDISEMTYHTQSEISNSSLNMN